MSEQRSEPETSDSNGGAKVTVVVPAWKRGDLLRECLVSLREQTFTDFQTIVVANGAGPWAGDLAREFGCRLIEFPENRGFAAAVNAGIASADSTYVLVLNDDAKLEREWLHRAVVLLEDDRFNSFCCGKICQLEGLLMDNAGDAVSMAGAAWRLGHGRPDASEFSAPKPLICVSMTAALFRRAVFDQAGNLDENFISYLEDTDFSIRLWRAGLKGVYLPDAVARHRGGASLGERDSPERFRLMTRNQLVLLAKHFPWRLRLSPRTIWAQALWLAMAVRKGLPGAYLSGIWAYIRLACSAQWREDRRRSAESRDQRRAFAAWLRESERAIYEDIMARPQDQRDAYWRWYFALFRPGRSATARSLPAEAGGAGRKRDASPTGEASLR